MQKVFFKEEAEQSLGRMKRYDRYGMFVNQK